MEDDILVTETSPTDEGRRSRLPFIAATILLATLLFGISLAASLPEEAVVAAGEPVSSEILQSALTVGSNDDDSEAESGLGADIAERDDEIEALEQQIAFLQQAFNGLQSEVDETEALTAQNELAAASSAGANDSIGKWRIGYSIGGGENLSSFENIILPCESGSQPDPDTAVGRTDDWGRAQINRPTWKNRFEDLTGVNFEENITDPILNGFMAAHVEQEQGLNAWTCWRRR